MCREGLPCGLALGKPGTGANDEIYVADSVNAALVKFVKR
jgi:hypothetical protein